MLISTLSGLVHVFCVLYSTYLLHTCTVLRTQSLALAIGYIFYSLRWFSRYAGLFCQFRSRLNNFTQFNLRSGPVFLSCYILTPKVRVINSNFLFSAYSCFQMFGRGAHYARKIRCRVFFYPVSPSLSPCEKRWCFQIIRLN